MLVKDFKDLKVSLIPSLSQDEFNSATKEIFKKFDYPIPVIGEENWESFDYLISKGLPPIPDEIQRSIGSWSSRKSDLFSRDHIELAMRTLQDSGINGNRNTPKTLNL